MKKLNLIMLIDDDQTTNFINELLIEEMGISNKLVIATNGKEALELVTKLCIEKNSCPDLIFLDINMPVMNGFEFLEKYNLMELENKNSTVVVMLTTSLAPEDMEQAKKLYVKDYINKPLLEEEIKKVLLEYF